MPEYIGIPIVTDAETLALEAFETFQARFPGWQPADGNLETWLIEAEARISSILHTLASRQPTSIFRYFGESLAGLQPLDAAAASGATTWTMRDTAGYTIPAGTLVGYRAAGDELIAYRTTAAVTVSAGSSVTAAGEVPIAAVIAGAAASGLGSVGADMELIDHLDYVTVVELTGATSGGADAETDTDYLNRLRSLMQLLTPTPILPRDFAILARQIPGIARALALDGYNPVDDTDGNERMVCVFPVDADGEALLAGVKDELSAYLESLREITFVANVADPTYTTIDVAFAFTTKPGFSSALVQAAAEEAVAAYLSPANWGLPEDEDADDWVNRGIVYQYELVALLDRVAGIERVVSVSMAVGGGTLVEADVSLVGVAPVPLAGAITGVAV